MKLKFQEISLSLLVHHPAPKTQTPHTFKSLWSLSFWIAEKIIDVEVKNGHVFCYGLI